MGVARWSQGSGKEAESCVIGGMHACRVVPCRGLVRQQVGVSGGWRGAGFLMVWLTLLPFALWDVYGWASPGLQARVSMVAARHVLWACHMGF